MEKHLGSRGEAWSPNWCFELLLGEDWSPSGSHAKRAVFWKSKGPEISRPQLYAKLLFRQQVTFSCLKLQTVAKGHLLGGMEHLVLLFHVLPEVL